VVERSSDQAAGTRRDVQRDATRARILAVAVEALVARGVAGTTTLAVQQRAGIGRGTLLHHFPTHAALLTATVTELVGHNEAAVLAAAAGVPSGAGALERAVRTLAAAAASPSYLAEMELWTVARSNPGLRDALRQVERRARPTRDRAVARLFAPLADRPGAATVAALTVEVVRGLAVSGILRGDPDRQEGLLRQWIAAASVLLDAAPAAIGAAAIEGGEDR
jgi:AcrR family transcriptional regulator